MMLRFKRVGLHSIFVVTSEERGKSNNVELEEKLLDKSDTILVIV